MRHQLAEIPNEMLSGKPQPTYQAICSHKAPAKITPSSDFAGVEAECKRKLNGSLVSVHDAKENDFIASKILPP